MIDKSMNQINPKKLLNSKWTKVLPTKKEKHFLITELKYDENELISDCLIEAIISKNNQSIDWNELKDSNKWQQGWK